MLLGESSQAFVNAESWREIVFTRNATEAINLVAASWGAHNLGEGDEVVLSVMEHHSNIVPWQVRGWNEARSGGPQKGSLAPNSMPAASIRPLSKCLLVLSPPSRGRRAHGCVCSLVT
jgi:hypothetical protein